MIQFPALFFLYDPEVLGDANSGSILKGSRTLWDGLAVAAWIRPRKVYPAFRIVHYCLTLPYRERDGIEQLDYMATPRQLLTHRKRNA